MINLLEFYERNKDVRHLIVCCVPNGVQYKVDSQPFQKKFSNLNVMIKRIDCPTTRYACAMDTLFLVPHQCPVIKRMQQGIPFKLTEINTTPKAFVRSRSRINIYASPKRKQIIAVYHEILCKPDGSETTLKRAKAKVKRAKKDKPDLTFAIMYASTLVLEGITTSQMKVRVDKMFIPYGQRNTITFKDLVKDRFYRAFPGTIDEADKFIKEKIQTLSSKYPTVTKW